MSEWTHKSHKGLKELWDYGQLQAGSRRGQEGVQYAWFDLRKLQNCSSKWGMESGEEGQPHSLKDRGWGYLHLQEYQRGAGVHFLRLREPFILTKLRWPSRSDHGRLRGPRLLWADHCPFSLGASTRNHSIGAICLSPGHWGHLFCPHGVLGTLISSCSPTVRVG